MVPRRWDPGTTRVAPFSGVKSSSSQIELHTSYAPGFDRVSEVGVQALMPLPRQSRAAVERRQLELTEHVLHRGQDARMAEAHLELRVLVDQIGEPVGAVLLMHFQAGPITLGGGELRDPLGESGHLLRREDSFQREESIKVELILLGLREHVVRHTEVAQRGRHIHPSIPSQVARIDVSISVTRPKIHAEGNCGYAHIASTARRRRTHRWAGQGAARACFMGAGYDSVGHLSWHVKAATGSAPGALRI